MVTLLGIAYDGSSSFERGAALAPAEIRRFLRRDSSNSWTESGIDVFAPGVLDDAGDVAPSVGAAGREQIERVVAELLDRGAKPLILGGDHSITYPVLRAFGPRFPGLTVVHFDAHSDLYEEFEGDRYSHACPFARVLEDRLASRLIQIGIRTLSQHQRDQAARYGVEVHEMSRWAGPLTLRLEGPVYLSVDLDALDPAFAAGISHPEPGGLSVRDLVTMIQRLEGKVIGADFVEFNPANDSSPRTGMVAAKLVKELIARLEASR
jgi:agmatinase